MSLDAFAVFVGFLAATEIVLGVVAVAVGLRDFGATDPAASEARRPLLVLVIGTLLAVALASCPLFYLLLASWVPRWPGIMCVEGVRRIGMGSLGAPAWLPRLVSAIDLTKPLLVFVAGAWMVLRRSMNPGAIRGAAVVVLAVGALAVFDGAVQGTYVAIPKQEIPQVAGCCMAASVGVGRETGLTAAGGAEAPPASAAVLFVAGSVLLGLCAGVLGRFETGGVTGVALLALVAGGTIPFAVSFLADLVAPAVLHMPFHHCIWCAFAEAPETIAGAALYLAAVLCAGWAFVARAFSLGGNAIASRTLLTVSSFGFLGVAAMSAVTLWRA